jgi:hypothetical protein
MKNFYKILFSIKNYTTAKNAKFSSEVLQLSQHAALKITQLQKF